MTDIGWKCDTCQEWYAHSYDTCPKCIYAPKITPKTDDIKDSLSYAEYKQLSPNKVSKEEYNRYVYLHRLWRNGVISNLETQVKYEVLPQIKIKSAKTWYKGFTQSRVTYSPDFRYTYDGITVIEEYKSLNIGTKRKPRKTPLPRIRSGSRKSIKELIATNTEFINLEAVFVITGWHKGHGIYYAFNANSRMFDYPLANYNVFEERIAA